MSQIPPAAQKSPVHWGVLLVGILVLSAVLAGWQRLRASAPSPPAAAPLLFANTGAQHGTAAVRLGGTYQLDWTARALQPWPLPTWRLVMFVHPPTALSPAHTLLDAPTLPATGLQQGTVRVQVPAGTYVLDVGAGDSCAWTAKLTPLP